MGVEFRLSTHIGTDLTIDQLLAVYSQISSRSASARGESRYGLAMLGPHPGQERIAIERAWLAGFKPSA